MRGWQRTPPDQTKQKPVRRTSYYVNSKNLDWLTKTHLLTGKNQSTLINQCIERCQLEDRLFEELDKIVRRAVREECNGKPREEA